MHNCSLFQTSKARLLKKQNEKQGSSFQFFKPGNSLVPQKLVCCPVTGLIIWALFILSVSGDCLALILSFPSLFFHYVFMLLSQPDCLPISSHTLPTVVTCAGMPLLSCSLCHTLALSVEYIVQKAPSVEVCQLFVVLPMELKSYLQFASEYLQINHIFEQIILAN